MFVDRRSMVSTLKMGQHKRGKGEVLVQGLRLDHRLVHPVVLVGLLAGRKGGREVPQGTPPREELGLREDARRAAAQARGV